MDLTGGPSHGAFVISLDLELYWGVRDVLAKDDSYRLNLSGEYDAILRILDLFQEFGIASTWATVGLLFAESSGELERFRPESLPNYHDRSLSPYPDIFGSSADPSIRYAPELIDRIKNTPKQEIGTHTFSHYYCLEEGQDAQSFSADLKSAIAIADSRGVKIRSIVFPRNQHNPDYDNILAEHGIVCYRGNQNSRIYDFNRRTQQNRIYRATRLADSYVNVSGLNTHSWNSLMRGKLADVKASMFLRPVEKRQTFLKDLQFRRITKSLEDAAKQNRVFHLWWHPHNFGANLSDNLSFLRRVFDYFVTLEQDYGIRSLSMAETADIMLAI